jgi:hypothetical protein
VDWDINAETYPCRRATLRPKVILYQAPKSHPKATHKPTASVLLAHYYGILNLRYRSNALVLGLQHAWKALGRRLEVAWSSLGWPESVRTGLDCRAGRR